jgi:hypothetical protein
MKLHRYVLKILLITLSFILINDSLQIKLYAQESNDEEIIGDAFIGSFCSGMRAEPRINSEVIYELNQFQRVQLFDYYEYPYMKISVDTLIGYVSTACLDESDAVLELKYRDNQRQLRFIRKYGERDGNRIYNSEVWVGMTEEMLIDSWGRPNNKNVTETVFGKSEQWVYRRGSFNSDYVYVENGKVTAIHTND